jgi:hypothetical protein
MAERSRPSPRQARGQDRSPGDRGDAAKARTRDSTRVFAKRAEEVEGELRIVADPPVIIPIEDMIPAGSEWENPTPIIKKLLSSYRRTLGRQHHPLEEYRYVHSAYKMVGVGSVGTRCYIMLLTGRDHNDPLFLQVKEAQPSVLERFLGASTTASAGPTRTRTNGTTPRSPPLSTRGGWPPGPACNRGLPL